MPPSQVRETISVSPWQRSACRRSEATRSGSFIIRPSIETSACQGRCAPLGSALHKSLGIPPGPENTRGGPMREILHRIGKFCLALAALLAAVPAAADTLKIGYIDPLSGGAASAGLNAQKHMVF